MLVPKRTTIHLWANAGRQSERRFTAEDRSLNVASDSIVHIELAEFKSSLRVRVQDDQGRSLPGVRLRASWNVLSLTDVNGVADFPALPAGRIFVAVEGLPPEMRSSILLPTQGAGIELAERARSHLTITLTRSSSLRIELADHLEYHLQEHSAGAVAVAVSYEGRQGSFQDGGLLRAGDVTECSSMPPGDYKIYVTMPPEASFFSYIATLSIATGAHARYVIDPPVGAGQVFGIVRDEHGLPVPGARVSALSTVFSMPGSKQAQADANGRFVVKGLSSSVRLSVVVSAIRDANYAYTMPARMGGLLVDTADGQPVELKLAPGFRVYGYAPLDTTVHIEGEGVRFGSQRSSTRDVDGRGFYEFLHILPGLYSVSIDEKPDSRIELLVNDGVAVNREVRVDFSE